MLWRHFSAEEPWVLEWIRIPSDACGRAHSIWIRYVWTEKFLNPERKSCGFKNIRTRVYGARVEKIISASNPITCGRVNPDIFESDDVKSVFSLSPKNIPIWRLTWKHASGERSKFPATISLYGACPEDVLVQRNLDARVNPDTIEYRWTGEFDSNMLRVDRRGNFWIRKENVADSKISGHVWTGPNFLMFIANFSACRRFNFVMVLTIRPRPHVSGYFWIRNFFFSDSKISPSARIRWYPDLL